MLWSQLSKTLEVPPASHTHGLKLPDLWTSVWSNTTLCTAPISSHNDANMRLLQVSSSQSLSCAQYLSVQELGLLVMSWQEVPSGAENNASQCYLGAALTNPLVQPNRCSISANTYAVLPLKFSLVKALCYNSKYFLSCCSFRQFLAKQNTFSDAVSVYKAHICQKLCMSTNISRFVES